MNHMHAQDEAPPRFWGTRYGIGLIVLGAIASYFLATEHLAHVIAALPYLLLLACPVIHLFMHSGHGGNRNSQGRHGGGSNAQAGSKQQPKAGES
jgi:hypothetical protein